jgi:hypothetical protein
MPFSHSERIPIDFHLLQGTKWGLRCAARWAILAAIFCAPAEVRGERRAIDGRRSAITIRVYKSGLFSIFAHDHTISASIARGEIDDSANPSVEFWVDAGILRVADSDISATDRAEIQGTMEGPQVLEIGRFPQIHFRSTAVQSLGANRWSVRGDLDLHGQSHSVTAEVSESSGRYLGAATLSQRQFGITPVRIAGGTVRVKDSVKVEFEVATMP